MLPDLSTGPTSLIGLLTSEVVDDLVKDGYSRQQVATAVAMGMGIVRIPGVQGVLDSRLSVVDVPHEC